MGFKIPKGLDFQVQELDFVADNSACLLYTSDAADEL